MLGSTNLNYTCAVPRETKCEHATPIPLNSHASGVILTFSPPISRSHAQNTNSHASDSIFPRFEVQVLSILLQHSEGSNHNHNHNQLLNAIIITIPIPQSNIFI